MTIITHLRTDTAEDAFFLQAVAVELERARNKFPSANFSLVALMEEVGELAQARLKHAAGKWPKEHVVSEAVQVAAMAARVCLEQDASFNTPYMEP